MMTSAARTNDRRPRSGFTLLEMVVVLAVTMLLMGGALAAVYFSRDEEKLKDATATIEVMAKRARTIATLQQRPYSLEFHDGKVSLMPLAEALLDPDEREAVLESGVRIEDSENPGEAVPGAVRDQWSTGGEMALEVRRWSSDGWIPITDRDRQIWRFDPSGICEPIGVRVSRNGSWMMVMFHPLTAAIADSEMELK